MNTISPPTMTIPFVDLRRQYEALKHEMISALEGIMESSQFVLGKVVEDFESEFAAMHATKHCVGVGSGTDALHAVLWALDLKQGDEVITVPNTFIATAEAITLTGARVVFVDVDPHTFTMDPELFERAISKRTKAVIPVHLYGRPAAMETIEEVAQQHGITVVEDACQAHLASHNGKFVGQFGAAAAFSFYPGKNLGAYGEAGAVTTNDDELASRIRLLRDHGQEKKYHHVRVGHNYRMDGIQGAVLGVKLPHLHDWTELRRSHAHEYTKRLNGVGDLVLPADDPLSGHVYHLYVIQSIHRDDLREHLAAAGVSTGLHYPIPLHLQEAYYSLGYSQGDFPMSEQLAMRCLSLPMFPELSPSEIDYISSAVRDFFD